MKTKSILPLLYSLFFLITACQSDNKSTQATKEASSQPPTLTGSMQNFKEILNKLLPIVIDSNQFNSKDNEARINQDVKNLIAISKQVVHNPAVQHLDPSLRFISSAFSEDLKRVDESLETGKREYARYTLMNVTAYCIECHTRTSSGPSFSSPQLEKTLSNMKKMERGEYLLSTRQFDRAFFEFENVIKEGLNNNGNLFELDRAVRHSLSISIKFQKDPKKSLQIVRLLESNDKTPFYLKQSARSWKIAIQDWMKEKSIPSTKPDELLKFCEGLVKAGRNAQIGIADRGGDVYFLRALSDLHLVLAQNLTKEQLGQALYLTGISYEAVRDLSIWSLHENYYESCIRQVPHTKWAESCYKKLEESILFGYTGSSGVRLPMDVQLRLQELQKLALTDVVQ